MSGSDPAANDRVWRHIVERLVAASDSELDGADIQPATELRDGLDLGSLQAITLVMDLEEEFGIEVEDEELESLVTAGDVYALVERKRAEGPPA